MKILYLVGSLEIGGAEAHAVRQISVICRRDFDVQAILCSFKGGTLLKTTKKSAQNNKFTLYILDKRNIAILKFLIELYTLIRSEQPDIIHAYAFGPCLWARLLCSFFPTQVVCHYHGISNVAQRWSRFIEKCLQRKTDTFLFNSQSTQKVYNKYLSSMSKQCVIYNGIAIPTKMDTIDSPKQLNLEEPFEMVTICRLKPIKAIDVQIEAVAELHRRGRNVILRIVGDGAIAVDLKKISMSLQISDSVFFEGFHNDVDRFYRQAKCFLVTSYHETFCLSLCEAMLHGLVCIAPNVGGPSEIITDGVDGFLVDADKPLPDHVMPGWRPLVWNGAKRTLSPPKSIDSVSLANRIEYVIDHYADLHTLRQQARKTVMERFSMERHCNELLVLYHKLMNQTEIKTT
ncbi:MAG: glycosyltransferase [Paludibacter sp.]|nr:glycosyltransferase [Paludibacter sp.]MDD4072532.1 glycosyltransferase [Desulfobacterales bacterium]MDD4428540.1 glycosyltransferase [Paludibacter sp.]